MVICYARPRKLIHSPFRTQFMHNLLQEVLPEFLLPSFPSYQHIYIYLKKFIYIYTYIYLKKLKPICIIYHNNYEFSDQVGKNK